MYGHIHGSRSADAKFISHNISPCFLPMIKDLTHPAISSYKVLVGRYHNWGSFSVRRLSFCILSVEGKELASSESQLP
jgi:hypothetical protein